MVFRRFHQRSSPASEPSVCSALPFFTQTRDKKSAQELHRRESSESANTPRGDAVSVWSKKQKKKIKKTAQIQGMRLFTFIHSASDSSINWNNLLKLNLSHLRLYILSIRRPTFVLSRKNKLWQTSHSWPSDFCDYELQNDRIKKKSVIYFFNTKHDRIDCRLPKMPFWEERGIFIWGENSQGGS